jgi:protein-disulfide isomerase
MAKVPNKDRVGPPPRIEIKPPPSSAMVIPALIVGVAILAGSLVVKFSLDKTTTQLAEIRTGLNETKVALDAVASSKTTPAAPPRRGPDPNKKYTLSTKGRPAKGSARAKVEIVEFSDFQ